MFSMINIDLNKKEIRESLRQSLLAQLKILDEYEKEDLNKSKKETPINDKKSFTRCNPFCPCNKEDDCVKNTNYDIDISNINDIIDLDNSYIVVCNIK